MIGGKKIFENNHSDILQFYLFFLTSGRLAMYLLRVVDAAGQIFKAAAVT